MRTLLFQNNVHNTERVEVPGDNTPRAVNLTVRKGLKWADLEIGETVYLQETPPTQEAVDAGEATSSPGDEVTATIYDVKTIPFNALVNYPRMLKLGHDPYCRNYPGLFETMRKVYDGFLQHELVTLVYYELV